MEIKVGDKVRVREDAPRVYTRGLWEDFGRSLRSAIVMLIAWKTAPL